MNRNRRLKQGVAGRSELKLGQMLLVSFGLHLLIFLLFTGLILPRFSRPKPPVYFVDLLNMPVARPQAGRPDARPEPVKPAPEKKVVRPEPKPAPQAKPKVAAPLRTAPAKAKPAPSKPTPAPAVSYSDTQARIEEMKRRQELEVLKQKLAQLSAKDSRQEAAPVTAPVGMPEGRGDQAGVDQRTWLQAFFKANWSLSKYQVSNRDLETRVTVRYDAAGNLLGYEVRKPSGDQAFDDSVKRAVLRDKKLPFAPGQGIEEEIVFNLKDLLE